MVMVHRCQESGYSWILFFGYDYVQEYLFLAVFRCFIENQQIISTNGSITYEYKGFKVMFLLACFPIALLNGQILIMFSSQIKN